MRLIAHRVIDDRGSLADLAAYRDTAFDGVELDVRLDQDGELVVQHSPVFAIPKRARRTDRPRREMALSDALARLSEFEPGIKTAVLDIKSIAAAEAIVEHLKNAPPAFETAFICWHRDDAAIIRESLPDAMIYFCLAPIFSRSLGRVLPDDLYLFNAFPFLARSRRFLPRTVQRNRHNINVRLFGSLRAAGTIPDEANGICLHKLFCSRALIAYARRAELRVAVYGLSSADAPKVRAYRDLIDIGIIRAPRIKRKRKGALAHADTTETAENSARAG